MIELTFFVDAGIHKKNITSGKNSISHKITSKYDLCFKSWLDICLREKLKSLPIPLNLQIDYFDTDIFQRSSSVESKCKFTLTLSSATATELTVFDLKKELMAKYVNDFVNYLEVTVLDTNLIENSISPERLTSMFRIGTYEYRFCLFDDPSEVTLSLHGQS